MVMLEASRGADEDWRCNRNAHCFLTLWRNPPRGLTHAPDADRLQLLDLSQIWCAVGLLQGDVRSRAPRTEARRLQGATRRGVLCCSLWLCHPHENQKASDAQSPYTPELETGAIDTARIRRRMGRRPGINRWKCFDWTRYDGSICESCARFFQVWRRDERVTGSGIFFKEDPGAEAGTRSTSASRAGGAGRA